MTDLHQKLLSTFKVEHAEHVSSIRNLLTNLVKGKPENPSRDLDEIFRRAHTLKGASRAVDLRSVEQLAHRLETLFSRAREGAIVLDRSVLDVVHLVLNTSEDVTASPQELKVEHEPALQAIEQLLGIKSEAPKSEPRRPPSVRSIADAVASPTYPEAESVRVRAEDLDQLMRSSAQLVAESSRQSLVTRSLAGLNRETAVAEREWENISRQSAAALRRMAAQPDFRQLVRQIDSARDHMHRLSRQLREVRRQHQSNAWQLHQTSEQLSLDIQRARLVPAESLFEGFRKMVRDLARDAGKEVELRTTGLETHADRMVLQAVKDPVMHLLRNAISHGIESPEERRRAGKAPSGSLELRLEAHGRRLRIEVEDDGKGIDVQRIARVAVEKNLLSEAEALSRTPAELIRLVFEPGFSTLATTTELAGRGMGLSVVQEAVRRLQGEVELSPNAGAGAVVRLSVPLFVANHHVVVVACQGQKFALPSHNVERLYRKKISDIRIVEGKASLEIEGAVMPLYSLASLLELGEGESEGGELLAVLLVHSGSRKIAVRVDAFLDQREALIKDLGFPAGVGPKVLGGILLPDASVCVVLNPVGLAEAATRVGTFVNQSETKATPKKKPSASILVVDDSMTTRSLEKIILETQGYRVRLAVDGVDALAQLRLHSADLVITDIQMPRMDGFQLIEEIRKDKTLARIPIIVVTSLEKAEDQERGLALGIDAYVVKKKFDQKELLDAIGQIV